jgi:hypothetical protein
MKRAIQAIILFLFIIGIPGFVLAGPYLVSDYFLASDPDNLPDSFKIVYGAVTVTGPSVIQQSDNGDRRLYWDLGTLAPGTYNLNVSSTKDSVWGPSESVPVPFTFTKPAQATLKSPANFKLLK